MKLVNFRWEKVLLEQSNQSNPNHRTPKLKYKDFKLKEGKIRLVIWKKLFIVKVEEVAQRSCGYPIPGGVQGQVRCVIEHPGLVRSGCK